MSRFFRYFFKGMENGAIAQVDFEANNLYADVINMSNDFQVSKRIVVGRENSHPTRASRNAHQRRKPNRKK